MTGFFGHDDPFGLPPTENTPAENAPPEMTVGALSRKIKNLVEKDFSFVRVRGELSRVTVAKSGHMYTTLKDDEAVLDAVCWRGTYNRLGLTPAEGMDVVCTGRLTTYPGRSSYQLVIETMELAGAGALLKMLEDRRKKLAAEGLFDAARKKKIPFLPRRIGVVTSPTGAVIRDIIHRLTERFPCHVLVWPVQVQGQGAAAQIAAGIRGFNALPADSPLRPDVLIVARGGGSLEDLMPFNDEDVVRAAAESALPLISAVGHETDTTLIDHAADLRAPTPTAAAEKAVPVRADVQDHLRAAQSRMDGRVSQILKQHALHLGGLARGLGDPARRMEAVMQKCDHLALRLDGGLQAWVQRRRGAFETCAARLSAQRLSAAVQRQTENLGHLGARLHRIAPETLTRAAALLDRRAEMLESLSFTRVLERGYALVLDEDGRPVTSARQHPDGGAATVRFHDGDRAATLAADRKSG